MGAQRRLLQGALVVVEAVRGALPVAGGADHDPEPALRPAGLRQPLQAALPQDGAGAPQIRKGAGSGLLQGAHAPKLGGPAEGAVPRRGEPPPEEINKRSGGGRQRPYNKQKKGKGGEGRRRARHERRETRDERRERREREKGGAVRKSDISSASAGILYTFLRRVEK